MALQHLRSSTANKRPTPAGMSDGQLAMNTNSASPGLFLKDSAGALVKVGPVHVGTTAPNVSPASGGQAGNSTGEQWLDTSVSPNQMKVWNGSAWVGIVADELPVSKLQDGTAGQIVQTDSAGTGVEWSSTTNLPIASAAAPAYSFQGDPNTGLYSPGADQLAISTAGTGRVFVDANGRVGIGGSPSTALHLGGSSSQTIRINSNTSAGFVGTTGYITQIGANRNPIDGSIVNTGTATAFINLEADVSNGSIQFCTTGTNNAAALERMRITSDGKVGIGTSSPDSALQVNGAGGIRINEDGAGTKLVQLRSDYAGQGPAINVFTNDPLLFLTNNSERLRITSDGKVGIGTSSPGGALDVVAGNTSNYAIIANNSYSTGDQNFLQFKASSTIIGDFNRPNGTNDVEFNAGFGAIAFGTGTAGTATEKVRIDSSGRLLVGTSTARDPAGESKIEVFNGPISVSTFANSTGFYGLNFIKSRGTSTNVIVQNNDSLAAVRFFGADGTTFPEAARIESFVDGAPGTNDMPGRLVFYTTADGASSPTERMRVDSLGRTHLFTGSNHVLRVASSTGAGTSIILIRGLYSATDNADSGSESFRVFTNGDVVNTNNSYGSISDIKLKENIVDANSQWDDLKALQVRNYNFKEGQTHTQIGLIAQEVEQVSPGLVTESPDRDEKGNDLGTVTKSVNYSVLYMKAVKALQEAMDRIETLEAKVAALEGV